MRRLRLLALPLALPLVLLAACTSSRSARSGGPVEVRIVDPGAIVRNVDLNNDDAARLEVRAQNVSEREWRRVVSLLREGAWPAGVRDAAGRASRSTEIRRYRAFQIATLRGRALVFVPADQGDRVPADMQGQPFYVLLREGGVSPVRE